MTVKADKSGIGSFWTPGHRTAWLTFACSILVASAFPTSLHAATYYWQDDSGTSVAGFTTDSTGCGSTERDLFLTTLMSAGGFNCTTFRMEARAAVPQNLWLMIKDSAYLVATEVTGIDFALDFFDHDTEGGVTIRYELGYAQGGVFTSWGFVDEGPHEPELLYVTDLSSISGAAPAGSNLALRIIDVAPSGGEVRMFLGSDDSSGVLSVTETVVLTLIKRAFETDGTPIATGSTIPGFVEFKYLVYINNTGVATSDISVRDVLDPAFQYQAATIQVDNSIVECAMTVCTAAEEFTIFSAVNGSAFLSDAVDGDIASYTGAGLSIDAGDSTVANLQMDINADAVWAILFSVKMP